MLIQHYHNRRLNTYLVMLPVAIITNIFGLQVKEKKSLKNIYFKHLVTYLIVLFAGIT